MYKRQELGSKIRNERVDDYASKTLKSLREAIDRAETKMHEKADAILKANKQYMADNFSTLRNGRICVPVKKEYKFKIQGSVIDKSSTGSTLFIEPLQVARLYDEVQELKIDEEKDVYKRQLPDGQDWTGRRIEWSLNLFCIGCIQLYDRTDHVCRWRLDACLDNSPIKRYRYRRTGTRLHARPSM